jgi:hypothetical protein
MLPIGFLSAFCLFSVCFLSAYHVELKTPPSHVQINVAHIFHTCSTHVLRCYPFTFCLLSISAFYLCFLSAFYVCFPAFCLLPVCSLSAFCQLSECLLKALSALCPHFALNLLSSTRCLPIFASFLLISESTQHNSQHTTHNPHNTKKITEAAADEMTIKVAGMSPNTEFLVGSDFVKLTPNGCVKVLFCPFFYGRFFRAVFVCVCFYHVVWCGFGQSR